MPTVLTQSELNLIISDVREIIGDETISTDITYRISGSTVANWSPTQALIPNMYANSSVSAFKGSYTVREITESGGLIETGDIKFIIMGDDVSGVLSIGDMIVESATTWQSSTTYQIKDIKMDPLHIAYFIQSQLDERFF